MRGAMTAQGRSVADWRSPRAQAAALLRLLSAWMEVGRSRRHLAELYARLLADLGVGRPEAAHVVRLC